MSDLISRSKAIRWVKAECNPYGQPTLDYESGIKVIEHLERMPSAEKAQLSGEDATKDATSDLISRKKAVKALYDYWSGCSFDGDGYDIADRSEDVLNDLPFVDPAWTTEEVAEILANFTGDECACNFNGIDEWLPERCKYAESTCPNPQEKHGCWKAWLLQLAERR